MLRSVSPSAVAALFLVVLSAAAFTGSHLVIRFGAPESPLAEFYVANMTRTLYEASVLFSAFAFCAAAYALSPSVRRFAREYAARIGAYLDGCSLPRYALISHSAAALVLLLLNAPGILFGTFMIDDYIMYALATERSVWDLLWLPINDHVIPLFWLELKAIFSLTGTHPAPLNLPLFAAAVITIGGAATLLRMLGFSPSTLISILALFASSTIVSHQLYGFYAIAPYFQVLALFVLSLICFVLSRERKRFARSYLTTSLVLLTAAIFLESGGVWTPVAYALFALTYHGVRANEWNLLALVRKEVGVLAGTAAILILYGAYILTLSTIATESFYGPGRLPLSLATVRELYDVLSAGTLLSLFAPRLGLIMSQPRFADFTLLWQAAMGVLFASYAFLVGYALFRGTPRARGWGMYWTLLMSGTALLTAIARPSSHATAFYRDQNLLFPLFFLVLALTTIIYEWVQSAAHETRREARVWLVAIFLIIVFVAQQVFSFYKIQYYEDILANRALVERLHQSLVPALRHLAAGAQIPLSVPTLSPLFLEDGYHQFPDLSALSSFLGIHDVSWLPNTMGPYRASTTPTFIEALRSDERLRSLYLAKGEVVETCLSYPFGEDERVMAHGERVVLAPALDPSREYIFMFDLLAEDAPEKIVLDLSFENDFGAEGARAFIRIDQYTPAVEGVSRRYACRVDLNQIPAFALSRTVRDVAVSVVSPGSYLLRGYRFGGE